MSARSVAVLDRKVRAIEAAARARIDARCEALRLDLALLLPPDPPIVEVDAGDDDVPVIERATLPPGGPFTDNPNLIAEVDAATDDVAVIIERATREAYDESWGALGRDLRGILATIGRRELETQIKATLRRPGLLEDYAVQATEAVTITEARVVAEADRQWFHAGRYEDSWRDRLVAPGRVGVIGRRGRSLFATYPGLLRVPLIDILWAFVNADRHNFGDAVEVAIATG